MKVIRRVRTTFAIVPLRTTKRKREKRKRVPLETRGLADLNRIGLKDFATKIIVGATTEILHASFSN